MSNSRTTDKPTSINSTASNQWVNHRPPRHPLRLVLAVAGFLAWVTFLIVMINR